MGICQAVGVDGSAQNKAVLYTARSEFEIFETNKNDANELKIQARCKNFETGFSHSITLFTFFSKKHLHPAGKYGILLPT